MKYRYRPREVQAVRFVPGKPGPVAKFGGAAVRAIKSGNRVAFFRLTNSRIAWDSIEGDIYPGDWLVRLDAYSFARFTDDDFHRTFEVSDVQDAASS